MDAQTGLLKSSGGHEAGPRGPQRQIQAHRGLRGIAVLPVVAYDRGLAPIYQLPVEVVTPLFRRSFLMANLFFGHHYQLCLCGGAEGENALA